MDLTSRARSPRRTADPPPTADRRVLAACQLLAAHDLAERRRAQQHAFDLVPIRNEHTWHAAATRRRLEHDGQALTELVAHQRSSTARQLAAAIEPDVDPPGPGPAPWTSALEEPATAWRRPGLLAPDPEPPPTPAGVLEGRAAAWHALHHAREPRSA